MNISNFNYPSQSEALFLFWTTIILCVIIFGIIIFAFYKIYSHKSIVFDAEKHIVVKQNNKSYNNKSYNNKSYNQKPIQVKYSKQPSPSNYPNDVVKIQPQTPYTAIANNNDYDNDNDNDLDL
jgi:type II secretory pathway component PulC